MNIDDLLDVMNKMADMEIDDMPSFKAMSILAHYFRVMKIPTKYIGLIKLDVNESFFDDEEKAKEVLKQFATVVLKMKRKFEEEFGDEAEQILADSLSQMSLSYHM